MISTTGKVRLRNKLPQDAKADYAWQSDPELTRLDAAVRLSMPFSRYLVDYAAIGQNRRGFNTFQPIVIVVEQPDKPSSQCVVILSDFN